MRPPAGPAGLLAAGVSILAFALTADVWKQADPLQFGTLTNQQALATAPSAGQPQKQKQPAGRQRTQSETVGAPQSQRIARASTTREPRGEAARRRADLSTSDPRGVARPVRAKAPLRRKPQPASPVPPVTGDAPTPPELAAPSPPQASPPTSAAAPPLPSPTPRLPSAPEAAPASVAARAPATGAAPLRPPLAVPDPANAPTPPRADVHEEDEDDCRDRDDEAIDDEGERGRDDDEDRDYEDGEDEEEARDEQDEDEDEDEDD